MHAALVVTILKIFKNDKCPQNFNGQKMILALVAVVIASRCSVSRH